MELKHTIQILIKDIQDIENAIRNLNNYDVPPQIELDLAMSKLRRVYELLSLITSDLKSDSGDTEKSIREEKESPGTKKSEIEAPDPDQNDQADPNTELDEKTVYQDESDTLSIVPEDESETISGKDVEKSAKPPDENKEETHLEAENKNRTPESEVPQKKQKEPTILAEKFESDKSLNEKIAHVLNADPSSKVTGRPIDTIKRNIGINDRFQIIRELMNGDNEGFNELIQKLDDCSNFNEAFKHIETRFTDHLEHEGVKILIDLARRKYISHGNV